MGKIKYLVTVVMVPILLIACGTWVKPEATQQDFASDKYQCLQESQQQRGYATANQYGGSAFSGSTTNGGLFGSCMNAHGWYLQR